jgi:hypothetical protein
MLAQWMNFLKIKKKVSETFMFVFVLIAATRKFRKIAEEVQAFLFL